MKLTVIAVLVLAGYVLDVPAGSTHALSSVLVYVARLVLP